MATFLLIRHGETDAVGKLMAGWQPGWSLNPKGKQQVAELGQRLARLPIRAVYTSPLERAIETAQAIARSHELLPQAVDQLGELHVGEWEGLTMAELDQRADWKQFNTNRSGTRLPSGELIVDVQARMVGQLNNLKKQHGDEMVAVVSHGDPLRSALAYYLGIPLDFMQRFEVAPASVSAVEIEEWGPRVLCMNETGDVPL